MSSGRQNSNEREIAPLLDENQLAQVLRCSRRTLQAWREQGSGPDWVKLGGLVRYRPEAVLKFLQMREVSDATRTRP